MAGAGGMAFEALDANEPVPGVGPASPPEADLPPRQSDLGGDLGIVVVEGQEDDGGPLPELGRYRGGVLNGTEDILLSSVMVTLAFLPGMLRISWWLRI